MTTWYYRTNKLRDFLKLCTRYEQIPGFSSTTLQTQNVESYKIFGLIDPSPREYTNNNTAPNPAEVLLQWKFPNPPQQRFFSLSHCLACMDDVTTSALVLTDPVRGRAGKSVHMEMIKAVSANNNNTSAQQRQQQQLPAYMQATVDKIGQNLGFVRASVFNKDDEMLCVGTHLKYLPMGWLFDAGLHKYVWEFTKLYSRYWLTESEPIPTDFHYLDTFQYVREQQQQGDGGAVLAAATFESLPYHASLGGTIHGGCQAMLMEQVANEYLNSDHWQLEQMSVRYLSPPRGRQHKLRVLPLTDDQEAAAAASQNLSPTKNKKDRRLLLRVVLSSDQDQRAKSEGTLQFRALDWTPKEG